MPRIALALPLVLFAAGPGRAADPPVDFGRDVLPILSDFCFHCHGPDPKARKAKLRLDDKDAALARGVVVPGKPADSELVARITSTDPDTVMPPPELKRAMSKQQVETLRRWVEQGATWDAHWAFAPMARRPLPEVSIRHDAALNPIDRFVLDRLGREGLISSPPADKERLLRRVTLDLTGLPPTLAEVDAFLKDESPDAYEKVVDRLLASPRYGERMAADWLDAARFADTHGYQMDRYRAVWPYRDWVINAFNKNLPFNDFVTWQVAGDLLPNATKEQRLATAFNRLHMQNEEGGVVEEEFRVAYVVDRVNTFGTAFLGITFECCRCHDHKYDPVSQKDFYSLFAFFQNIDEAGQTTYFTSSTPVPALTLSTDEQDRKLDELRRAVGAKWWALQTARQAALKEFGTWRPTAALATPKPVASYSFDDLKDGKVPNAANEKSPGRPHDAPKPAAGKVGQAALLDGENGFTFPGVGHFTKDDPFTLSLWVKPPAEHAQRAVVVHHSRAPVDAGSRGYELLLENGRVAVGLHHMWPGNSLKVATKAAIKPHAWTHLTATYDGSGTAAGVKVYVDGGPAELDVIRDKLTRDVTYGGGEPDLTIGHRFRDSGFKGGAVDEFKVYDRALTAAEVAHEAGKPAAPDFEVFAAVVHEPTKKAAEELRAARKALTAYLAPIPEIMVMDELSTPKPAFVLARGAYDAPGDRVSADTPKVLPPLPKDAPRNRLGLAQWLTDPEHPLLARVTVNRAWQQMFGRGLVETADNFGTQGSRPTHPELLDWLAREFVRSGWDHKKLLKLIATSATYRQASKASPDLMARDPDNLLLARGPAKRLSAEMLRDQALAASGLLVEKVGGPSVKPYQPAGLWEEIAMGRPTYDQGKGADLYRRSLYTFWKRTVPPPAMATLDAADKSTCSVKRQATSTPLQALVLLNDVQFVEAARLVGERVLKEGGKTPDERAAYAFRLVTGRRPSDRERAVLVALLTEQQAAFEKDPAAAKKLLAVGEKPADATLPPAQLAACAALANALFSHDEAVTRR